MANRRRGEVEAVVAGRRYTLCLTLGALAELEGAFEVDGLAGLAERFTGGRPATRDLIRIFAAGLRGAGRPFTEADVAALPAADGLEAVACAVAELLEATFGAADAPDPVGDPGGSPIVPPPDGPA